MIPAPHGGHLVDRQLNERERERRIAESKDLLKIRPFIDQVYDAEKIGTGAYSPLDGFQLRADLESVLATGRLANGLPWTIPIPLAPGDAEGRAVVEKVRPGDEVGLLDGERLLAILHVEEKYPIDPKVVAEKTYGTLDATHPNVADTLGWGTTALGGKIDLVQRLELPAGRFELTPAEVRAEFARRGWKRVAGYQTRNVPHTAHEYLQRCTLEREDVDGLFVHPVVGRLKKGDYRPEVILEAYETLVSHYYPKDRVMLSSLTVTMRYGGPKAALFFAIVRKNFGCGLYIVGRDQAGVGTFYPPFACQEIFDRYDIDVVPLKYAETFYCNDCAGMASPRTCAHPAASRVNTSQTRIRKALADHEPLPREIIRPEVAEILGRGDVLLTE